MEKIQLGRTGLMVSRSGFGAIPIQRISFEEAEKVLLRAYESGVNFFDTARAYTDSEEKIGRAFASRREHIILATKTMAETAEGLVKDLEASLRALRTDCIDIYQFHNASDIIKEESDLYQAALKAKSEGKIKFISVTSHRSHVATELVKSGLFDTMQFPLSMLSNEEDLKIVELCKAHDVGLIAMKALSGGLIQNAAAAFAFIRSLESVVPIWGIQHLWQLEEFLALEKNPPELTEELMEIIRKDRRELAGNFCRACGYCMPSCPAGIPIATAARMSLLLRRMNPDTLVTPEQRQGMEKILDCVDCGMCKKHCPYGLDTPALLKAEYESYRKYLLENNL